MFRSLAMGLLLSAGFALWASGAEPKVTIIEYSWTTVDTKYLHDNVAEMEKRPFDGVCVFVAHPRLPKGSVLSGAGRGDMGWEVFRNVRIEPTAVAGAIEDLKATPFKTFRSNYAVVVSHLSDQQTMDWFDDGWWGNITHNANLLARAAKEGGCEGIMFDPEEYGCRFWGYPQLAEDALYEGKDYGEVAEKVKQRGGEYMRAINAAFPDARILLLHAWESLIRWSKGDRKRCAEIGYGLLSDFLDGMLEASHEDTIFIDGIEHGYYVEKLAEFEAMSRRVREEGPGFSSAPAIFRKKVRTGFGIWMDRDRHWDPVGIEKNFWTPEKFTKAVTNALLASDGFVWIYNERPTWLLDSADAKLGGGIDFGDPGRNETIKWLPRVYWEALEKAREAALKETEKGER